MNLSPNTPPDNSTNTNRKDLLQQEYDTNLAEANLLRHRIALMKEIVNDLPSSDPHYSKLTIQIQMDQIELDELAVRATLISQQLQDE